MFVYNGNVLLEGEQLIAKRGGLLEQEFMRGWELVHPGRGWESSSSRVPGEKVEKSITDANT